MGILYYSMYILYYSMYRLSVYVYKPLPPGFYPIAVDKYINNKYQFPQTVAEANYHTHGQTIFSTARVVQIVRTLVEGALQSSTIPL
jgi:hypothetical protein